MLMVLHNSVVLPDPGLDTRFNAKIPRLSKHLRFRAAYALFLARMSCSICTMRDWLRPGAWARAGPVP